MARSPRSRRRAGHSSARRRPAARRLRSRSHTSANAAVGSDSAATMTSTPCSAGSSRRSRVGVSSAMILPWSMIAIRSQSRSASIMSWVVRISVVPRSRRSTIVSHRNRRDWGSRPVVGSSRISRRGSCISARAIISRWAMPARVVVHVIVLATTEAEAGQQLPRPLAALAPPGAEVRGVEGQVLERGQGAVEVGQLRHRRDSQLRRHRVHAHVDAVDEHAAAGGPHPRGDRADRRRLAGAVGAEQAEDLALEHLEVDSRPRPRGPRRW